MQLTYSISVCHLFIQPLVLMPQLTDGLSVLLDGGLRALIVCSSVALWWTHFIITSIIHDRSLTTPNNKVASCFCWISVGYEFTLTWLK